MKTLKNSVATRLISRICRILLWLLRHARLAWQADIPAILDSQTEAALNLPGTLAFFPTRATSIAKVEALVRRLHPVACTSKLIRLGPDGDGGYLIPDDLTDIDACFSPGVNRISGFERDCAERGMRVFMADASVEKPAEEHPRFVFTKKFIGASTHDDFVSIEEWVTSAVGRTGGDLLLQMDIEGYEYEALLSLPIEMQKRFRIIVAEFHYLDYLFSEPLFGLYSKVFEKLLTTHACLHIHPNNVCGSISVGGLTIPQMAEFTFLRTDRIVNPVFATRFPHVLDRDNCNKPPLPLPMSCYRGQFSMTDESCKLK